MTDADERRWYLVRESDRDVVAGGYRSFEQANQARPDAESAIRSYLVAVELPRAEARERVDMQSRAAVREATT